ncbi:MAG: LptF/LptG family permease [Bacteroidetes bacterium]|nr:LptF/LptG family permease [Bacteroidota bacterium]
MKSNFLFSRRFWIPFILVLLAHLWWFGRELGGTYIDDFKGKGLPESLFREWLWTSLNGPIVYVSFLAAFITGITWFSHYNTKRRQSSFRPFSFGSMAILISISGLVFVYMAIIAPHISRKEKRILTEVVFARSYKEFTDGMKRVDTSIVHTVRALTLSELFDRKRSLQHRDLDEFDKTGIRYPLDNSVRKVRFEIAKRFSVPLIVALFYFCGIFMGFSFYKTYRLIPFFLSWILLALGWFVLDTFSSVLYRRETLGLFTSVWGPILILSFILFVWYWALRRYGFFHKKEEGLPADFLEG